VALVVLLLLQTRITVPTPLVALVVLLLIQTRITVPTPLVALVVLLFATSGVGTVILSRVHTPVFSNNSNTTSATSGVRTVGLS
jgi:hypothetical protein